MFSFALRGQTVHWIGAKFGICMVQGFHRQVLKQVPKCKWIPFTKFPWITCTNICKVNFVGTLVLLRIPQRANIGNCSGFRKAISANASGFRKFMRIPLIIDGFSLKYANSTYSCGFHDSLSLLNKYIIIYLWIPQTILDPANFVANYAKFLVFGAILSNTVF